MVQLTGLALVERCRLADEPRGSSGGGKLNRHFFDLLVAGNELTVARGHGQHQPAMLATTHRLYEPQKALKSTWSYATGSRAGPGGRSTAN